jgi:hypothetical protein
MFTDFLKRLLKLNKIFEFLVYSFLYVLLFFLFRNYQKNYLRKSAQSAD